MVASTDGAEWVLQVTGDADEFVEPPADLGAIVRSRSKSLGFDGQTALTLVLAFPLVKVAGDLSLNMLAAWLYDLFTRRRASKAPATSDHRVNITINGDVVIVADAAQLESKLKELRPDDK